MKKIILIITLLAPLFLSAQVNQPYQPFFRPNLGIIDPISIEFEKGDTTYYLNYFDGANMTTYILIDWQGSANNIPQTFDQGWSLNYTISPGRKKITLKPGGELQVVLDSNSNAYLVIE